MALTNISGRAVTFFLKKSELPICVTSLLNTWSRQRCNFQHPDQLNIVGISIDPIITALGVGGLAMALALQGTLSNLFAVVHVLTDPTVRASTSHFASVSCIQGINRTKGTAEVLATSSPAFCLTTEG